MIRRADWGITSDVDGTLTPVKSGALVKVVDDHALPESANDEMIALRAYYTPMAKAGRLTPADQMAWLYKTFDVYIEHGLTRQAWQAALDTVEVREGVIEAYLFCAVENIPFAAVSYGCADFIEYLFARHGVHFDAIYAGRLVHDGDVVVGYDKTSLVIPEHKGDRSRHFADTHGIPHERLIGVGDTGGDKLIGHEKEHRIGIVETPEDEEKLRMLDVMGEIHVSLTFDPVLESIKRRLGLP
ncbi:MAG: haloacid dehalogenase-like hydrolase [Patescibacteria group bacterium]|nr:MAG: haloacid dehalogenase-like hydrolase [Patescibacteria group bacterium]